MPDLPPELYVPAFGALVAALTWLTRSGTKMTGELWRRNQVISDRTYETAERVVTAIDASTAALHELRTLGEEQLRVANQLLAAAESGGAHEPQPRNRPTR